MNDRNIVFRNVKVRSLRQIHDCRASLTYFSERKQACLSFEKMRKTVKYIGLTCRNEIFLILSFIFIGNVFHLKKIIFVVAVNTLYLLAFFCHIVKYKEHSSNFPFYYEYTMQSFHITHTWPTVNESRLLYKI